MKQLLVLGAVASIAISVSVTAKTLQAPVEEEQRMESISEQVTGKIVGVNVVDYGGGKLMLPVVQSDSEMCVSIVNSMNAIVENPSKAKDYDYQIAVHCDETTIEKHTFKDKEYSSTKSKGFQHSFLIELDKGIVMHSVKYTSGDIKIWPSELYEDFLVQNDKEVKVEVEALNRREVRRAARLSQFEEPSSEGYTPSDKPLSTN